jgi:hypothetical protein
MHERNVFLLRYLEELEFPGRHKFHKTANEMGSFCVAVAIQGRRHLAVVVDCRKKKNIGK